MANASSYEGIGGDDGGLVTPFSTGIPLAKKTGGTRNKILLLGALGTVAAPRMLGSILEELARVWYSGAAANSC